MPVNVLYRTSARATGGRDGHSATLDGAVDVKLVPCEGERLAHMGSLSFTPSGTCDYWSLELYEIAGFDPAKEFPRRSRSFSLTCILTTAKRSRKPLIK
jgi:hypothetical protein